MSNSNAWEVRSVDNTGDPRLKQPGRPWRAGILWLLFLVPFFLLSYGLAAWITSRRAEVPSLVFAWDHRIPFLAWTIVPYSSIDFLYVLSIFMCRNRAELDVHAKRLLAAQVISVVCFLLFPLQFSFERPQTVGLFGWLFHTLRIFDSPFNQAPSLHISLTTILWAKFSEHMHGWKLFLLRCWLVLAGVSTLTTYQHHLFDVPAGICVGLVCMALFRPARAKSPGPLVYDEPKLT